jgi:glucan biosynthesis protein C
VWFGALGYHLWFLGFLFSFSLLTLPVCLCKDAGKKLVSRLAGFCCHRGAILLFFLPLALVRIGLQPFFPQEHSWADFCVQLAFYLAGYILFSHQGFLQAILWD